jgi:hypothetical protein
LLRDYSIASERSDVMGVESVTLFGSSTEDAMFLDRPPFVFIPCLRHSKLYLYGRCRNIACNVSALRGDKHCPATFLLQRHWVR